MLERINKRIHTLAFCDVPPIARIPNSAAQRQKGEVCSGSTRSFSICTYIHIYIALNQVKTYSNHIIGRFFPLHYNALIWRLFDAAERLINNNFNEQNNTNIAFGMCVWCKLSVSNAKP